MDKQEAIQNKKRIRTERRQERNRVETVEQKVERLRKVRERQRQKLVNETAQEKEIRLAKRREAYKKRSEERKGKTRKYLRERGDSENVEKSEKADSKT